MAVFNGTITDDVLQDINDEKARVLIPAMIYCCLLMIIGTAGNVLVVYFYGFKSKTTSATCFIMALALFDLTACLFGIPIEISDMVLFYLFRSVAACRLLVFVNHFAVIASAFTLCFIAIDRYKRICKPFDRQMSVKRARITVGVCAGLGVFLGWPSVALYTVEEVAINTTYQKQTVQIIGYDCTSVKAEAYSVYAWVYSVIQFVGFIGITITLIVCYFLVGRQLFKHKKFRFYVAQKGLRRTASGNVTTITSQTDYSSDPVGTTIPITSIPEEDEDELEEVEYEGPDDDPPMMQESIPDLRELLELDINGLPDVDEDRPTSGFNGIFTDRTDRSGRLSRPNSILTDISTRSRGSIMTVRSVVICDESENQVFSIEPRDESDKTAWRPRSARSDSTWSNSITRPGSACSINPPLSRPSSVTSILSTTEIEDHTDMNIMQESSISGGYSSHSNTKIHGIAGAPYPTTNGLKRTRSDDNVVARAVKRTSSNKSLPGKKPGSIRRTMSEGNSIVKRTSSERSISSRLRRTGSTESTKMDTDTDNLKDLRMKMLDINTVKYTFIMIIIAVVFILSCVPYLGLAVWRVYADENLVYEFSDMQLVWFQIGIRSYFLNCAINPFIYGFFNSQFRAYFFKACCRCCNKEEEEVDVRK